MYEDEIQRFGFRSPAVADMLRTFTTGQFQASTSPRLLCDLVSLWCLSSQISTQANPS